MQTVEPVFGQIKQGRGFRQFLLRGLEKVNGEWSLICTGHNLLKLFRFGVNLHRKARVDGPAQRIRNFAEVVEHGAIRKAIWGPAGASGKISWRDPLSLHGPLDTGSVEQSSGRAASNEIQFYGPIARGR